jgi:hypothetical protein
MKPHIINEDSNFVVITYWWGRGNLNKNTQIPCPDQYKEGDKMIKEPITYDQMIEGWKANLMHHKCNYLVQEYPEFAVKGGYQNGVNFKPTFIREALKACHPRSIVYIDGDMFVNRYPHIFDMKDVDYMARGWNSEPRDHYDGKKPCFDPYVFETSGGIQFFGQTKNAYRIIDTWIETIKKYPGKADDRIMAVTFNHYKFLLTCTTIQLPFEYLWLTMDYNDEINKKFYKKKEITVEHPACLTSEDRAFSLGASSNRVPPNYDRNITNKVKCSTKYGDFYDYIFFDSKNQRNVMETYIRWLKNHKVLTFIPYNQKYGKYNKVAKMNVDLGKAIALQSDKATVILTHDEGFKERASQKEKDAGIHYLGKEPLMPTICKYLKAGQSIIYVPKKSVKMQIRKVMQNMDGEIEFIARNTNRDQTHYKKEFILKLDQNYPMYFNHKSEIMQHLVNMSEDLNQMQKIFDSSFIFLSRLRCKWL